MKKTEFIRLCALIIASVMMLSLFACNNGNGGDTTTDLTDVTTESETVTTDTVTEGVTTETQSETTDEITTAATENTTVESTIITTEETTEETIEEGCEHPYVYTPEGHYKDACSVCGKGVGKTLAHEYELRHEDEGDLFLYRYICTICNYVAYRQEVPYGLGMFISPAELADAGYYSFASAAFTYENGSAFARFTTVGASNGAFVYAYNSADTSEHTGNYMVIKVRLGGNRSNLKIAVSSIESAKLVADEEVGVANATKGRLEVTATGLTSDWAVVVIDLTKVNKDGKYGYIPKSGDYMLRELRIYMDENSTFGGEDYLDIGYIMLCDTMEEVRNFTKSEPGLYTYPDIMKNNKPTVEGSVCVHTYTYDENGHAVGACSICGASEGAKVAHSYGFVVEGSTYKYGCICGYVLKEKTIPDTIEKYIGPNNVVDGSKPIAHCKNEGLMADEDGTVFTRLTGPSGELYSVWSDESKFDPGKAKYAVIKVRSNVQASPAQHALRFYFCHTEVERGVDRIGVMLSQKILQTDDWVVIVVDLEALSASKGASAYKADENGEFPTINRVFFNMWSPSFDDLKSGYYYDYAYLAFCDSWEEIDLIVDERTVEYMDDTNGNSTTRTTDGAIATDPEHEYDSDNIGHKHTCDGCPTAREAHTFASALENGVYTLTCSVCGYTVNKNIPTGVTLVSSQKLAEISVSGNLSKSGVKIGGDGTSYVRVTNTSASKNYGEIYPVSHSKPANIVSGDNKYAVIKLRTSSSGLDALRFRVGHNNGGEGFNESDVYGSIDLNYKAVKQNVWTVFVVDLTAFTKIDYKLSSAGAYPEITNMNIQISLAPGATVDYSYIALCSDWAEIDAVVDEASVQYVMANGASETRAPDGGVFSGEEETVDTSAEESSENVEITTEEPEEVTTEKPEESTDSSARDTIVLGDEYLGAINVSNNISSLGIKTDSDGTKYLSVINNGTSMTYGEIYPVEHSVPAPINPGVKRYIVIKMRSDTAIPDVVRVRIGHNHGGPDCNVIETYGAIALDKSFIKAGEWAVFVIDMTAMTAFDFKLTSSGNYPNITRHNLQLSLNPGQSADIAYIGFCYDWDAIDALVDESSVCYITASGKGEKRMLGEVEEESSETVETPEEETTEKTEGETCEGEHTYVESRQGDTWAYKCSACGSVKSEKSVPAGAVYLSAVYLSERQAANGNNAGLAFDEDGTAYAHVTGAEGKGGYEFRPIQHANPAAVRPGNNKYLVIKMRANTTSVDTRLWYGNNAGGENYNETVNPSAVLNNQKLQSRKDWVVFVIDLEQVYPTAHREIPATGQYPEITQLYGYFKCAPTGYYDFSYMAICEDWTAVDALVEESTVEYMTTGGTSRTVKADGTAVN